MEITQSHLLPYKTSNTSHRNGGIALKFLSTGTPNTRENYSFFLARQRGFYSPRHQHNFDQFRVALEGDVSLSPDLTLKQGQVSFHPEGVHYGPQSDGDECDQVVLVLQFGGASGQGFIALDQLGPASEELKAKGRFEGGRYFLKAEAEGEGEEDKEGEGVDGYETVWTHLHGGQRLVYPQGRYDAPIIMTPSAFRYDKRGKKLLGVFTEREVAVVMHRVDGGSEVTVGGDDAVHLLFVLSGEATVGGETIVRESCVRLLPGMSATVNVAREKERYLEMMHFVMPTFKGE